MTAAVYVYGVVAGDAAAPSRVPDAGSDPEGAPPVRTVRWEDLGALVADLPPGRDPDGPPRGADVRRHMAILEAALASGPVLPFRFGTVVPGDDAVVRSVLEPNRSRLVHLLDDVRDAVEVQVRASYDQDAVVADVLAGDRRLQRQAERVRGKDPAAVHGERLQLGEAISRTVDARRPRDAARVESALEPHARQLVRRDAAGSDTVVDLAALVSRDALTAMDDAVAAVSAALAPAVMFRYLGPMPPYSFVDLDGGA